MAAAQMSRIHIAPQGVVPAPRRVSSNAPGALSRVGLASNFKLVKSSDDRSARRLCVRASVDEVESDGSMEWLSPTDSTNPMEKWLQRGHEREGDAWREECGVVAIFGDPEASRLCYLSLHALQHRGQEGAGIVTANEHTLHAVTGNLQSSKRILVHKS